MRTIHFHGGFHLFCMTAALAVGFGLGSMVEAYRPHSREPQVRVLDATHFGVVGVGCGKGRQFSRVYIAVEEDNLPGPKCQEVYNLTEE